MNTDSTPPVKELAMADIPDPEPDHVEDTVLTTDKLHISVRGMIVCLVVLTVCFMSVYGLEVKEPLYTLSAMTVGWYFGRVPNKRLT